MFLDSRESFPRRWCGVTRSVSSSLGYDSFCMFLELSRNTLLRMIHASLNVASDFLFRFHFSASLCLPLPSFFPLPFPIQIFSLSLSHSFSLSLSLSVCTCELLLSVSLEHPRVTIRPRRWTGEDWHFTAAATCSTASNALTGTDFPPLVEATYACLPGTRLSSGPPIGPDWAPSLNQS